MLPAGLLFGNDRLGCRGIESRAQKAGFQPQSNLLLPEPVKTGSVAAGF